LPRLCQLAWIRIPGDENDRQCEIGQPDRPQHLDPIDRWQAKVKENGVRPVAIEMAQPFLTGMGDGRLVALVGECARKQFGDQDVILDEKQLDWAPSLPPADIP